MTRAVGWAKLNECVGCGAPEEMFVPKQLESTHKTPTVDVAAVKNALNDGKMVLEIAAVVTKGGPGNIVEQFAVEPTAQHRNPKLPALLMSIGEPSVPFNETKLAAAPEQDPVDIVHEPFRWHPIGDGEPTYPYEHCRSQIAPYPVRHSLPSTPLPRTGIPQSTMLI